MKKYLIRRALLATQLEPACPQAGQTGVRAPRLQKIHAKTYIPFKKLLILSFCVPVVLLAQVSFMENPSVEKAAPNNPQIPLGFPEYMSQSKFKWTDKTARTGQKGIEFSLWGKSALLYWYCGKLTPGKIYKFSCYYKTAMSDYQACIIQIHGHSGENTSFLYPSATQWTQAQIFFQCKQESGNSVGFACEDVANIQPEEHNKKIAANPPELKGTVDDFDSRAAGNEDFAGANLLQIGAEPEGFADDFDFHEATQEDFARDNLLPNGDFEADPHSAPGWDCYPGKVHIDTQEHCSGKQSARIELSGTKRTDFFSNRMPFKAGGIYVISFAVKASEQMRGSFGFCVNNAQGEWQLSGVNLNNKWKEYLYILEMPGKDTNPRLYTTEWGYRKEYFGEVFLGYLIFRSERKKAEKGQTYVWEEGTVWMDKCVIKMISDKPLLDD